MKPIFKGRPQANYGGGTETSIPHVLRAQGLL
jgi:hypothetical protein